MRTDKTWWEQAKNWRKWTKTCWCGRKGQNQVNKINPLTPRPRRLCDCLLCSRLLHPDPRLISANISPAAARPECLAPLVAAPAPGSSQLRGSVRSFPAKTAARRRHDSSHHHHQQPPLYSLSQWWPPVTLVLDTAASRFCHHQHPASHLPASAGRQKLSSCFCSLDCCIYTICRFLFNWS